MKKGCLISIGSGLAGLAILITASYLILDPEKKVLAAQDRTSFPGDFISLTDGVTHYTFNGPVDGPVVVLVHGFSVPGFAWERNVPDLVKAGFRVLTLDLYGRGYSDRPDTTYNLDLYVRQIDELLTALRIEDSVDIAGISLGGYIAVAFANQYPNRVDRVVLISPESQAIGSDPLISIVTLPWIGEYLYTVYLARYQIVDGIDYFDDYMPSSDWHERELNAMSYKGERNALLSTLRSITDDPLDAYRILGASGKPVELLWGDKDTTISCSNAARIRAVIPQAEYHPIPGARHMSIYEKPEMVNQLMIQFFKGG